MRVIVAVAGNIFLGKRGENLATQVRFPVVQEWTELFGSGTYQLLNRRPTEDTIYPCVTTVNNNDVCWDITGSETANIGNGECELRYYVTDEDDNQILAKSIIFTTLITPALAAIDPEPPEPWQTWVDEVLEAANTVEQSVTDAQQAATDAAESAQAAGRSEQAAKVSEDNAAESESNSEAWAVGERQGVPVEDTDPTYENNSKYYCEEAKRSIAGGQFFGFYIDDNGELYVTKTPDATDIDFHLNLETGHLEVILV